MAANKLVRRSTTRLLCLVRSQVASFFTERPRPSAPPFSRPLIRSSDLVIWEAVPDPVSMRHMDEAHSKLKQYWKKYNPLSDFNTIDEILDGDKEWQNLYHPSEREMAEVHIEDYWRILASFHDRLLTIMFKEHLVKHCSHRKIQWDAVLKFEVAFKRNACTFVEQAEHYYNRTVEFRDKKKVPKGYQATLLKEVENSKEELRKENRRDITDEIMLEIEEDIMKKINEDIVKEKKRTGKKKEVNEEMVARGTRIIEGLVEEKKRKEKKKGLVKGLVT